jgi:hypothetical protein
MKRPLRALTKDDIARICTKVSRIIAGYDPEHRFMLVLLERTKGEDNADGQAFLPLVIGDLPGDMEVMLEMFASILLDCTFNRPTVHQLETKEDH